MLQTSLIRVLVVDDSVVARRVVGRAIEQEDRFELSGVAGNGRAAIEKIDQLRPDVVVLDLEMPVMDGFETLAAVRRTHPDLPIIVFSHLTGEGASATLDALALGATGFALKPNASSVDEAQAHVRRELLPLIAAVAQPRVSGRNHPASAPTFGRAASPHSPVEAIVVAVSTGGPNALAEVIPALPADLSVPVLVVQHMPALFTQALARRLNRVASVDVCEANDRELVLPGHVYVAPGGRHMTVQRDGSRVEVVLCDDPPENSCRPAADVLFRSAAQAYGAGVVGVVLTGMGADGTRGCEAVRAAGGTVIAQDAASAVVASMPVAVANAGLANAVLPLGVIGPTLTRWTTGSGR